MHNIKNKQCSCHSKSYNDNSESDTTYKKLNKCSCKKCNIIYNNHEISKCDCIKCSNSMCENNGDYDKYKFHIASFKKGLVQDKNNLYEGKQNIEKFRYYLKHRKFHKFNNTIINQLQLIDPVSALAIGPEFKQFCKGTMLPYKYSSKQFAIELTELYLMYLLRDQNLVSISSDPLYTYLKNIDPRYNLFGESIGDSKGYPVSQFLLVNIPCWNMGPIVQKHFMYASSSDKLSTLLTYENLHFNAIADSPVTINATSRYCITGRDLATIVHKDTPMQCINNAVTILFGSYASSLKTPFNSLFNGTVKGFNDFGFAGLQKLTTDACLTALRCTWYQKFVNHFVLRPEEFGYNVEKHLGDFNTTILDPSTNEILKQVYTNLGNYLLPTAYSEGSPTHPSYPSGHATIAGAGITVLKAFFNESGLMINNVPDMTGSTLNPNPINVFIGDELNKLATNIGMGRNWAGIHYRMDFNYGIKLGEDVAIQILCDYKKSLPYDVTFNFTRYHGKHVTI